MSPPTPSDHPHIYCDLSTDGTERGFSLETARSVEDLARMGLTLESAVGLAFVFGDGSLKFKGEVIHDPELGYLATNQKATEAGLLKAKAFANGLGRLMPVFLGLASLAFVLTLPLVAWGTLAGARNLGGFAFNGAAIGAALGVLSIVLSVRNYMRNKGPLSESLIAVSASLLALCIHLPIVALGIWIHYGA